MSNSLVGNLISQGAEAKLYQADLYKSTCKLPCIVKERFKKRYRHPDLDSTLSGHRMRSEVRQLLRCRELGIDVPPVLLVDLNTRRLWLGQIGPYACTLQDWFGQLFSMCEDRTSDEEIRIMCLLLGQLIAKLHANHIIHGDLTMANILVRMDKKLDNTRKFSLIPIDFGLSSTVSGGQSQRLVEDKAVDFYVFERALSCGIDHQLLYKFASDINSQDLLVASILKSYENHYIEQVVERENSSACNKSKEDLLILAINEIKEVLNRLDEVRLRGRKRTMIG